MSAPTVRIRGIYTTALTRAFLDADLNVVQPSDPIERRFNEALPVAAADVTIETTADRQGISIVGPRDEVDAVSDVVRTLGRDTFVWESELGVGTIADGEVTATAGGGAVVEFGLDASAAPGELDAKGYLPFTRVAERITPGDMVRARVVSGVAPWSQKRPLLDTRIEIDTGLATLRPGSEGISVDTRDEAAGRELVGMTELLGQTPPEGWGIRWSHEATTADMETLRVALESAIDRATTIEDTAAVTDSGLLDADETPKIRVPGETTQWVWFGCETRTALDEKRRAVTATMSGHHRIKAGSDAASAGVDFVEALCEVDGSEAFPFSTVTDQFGPTVGDTVSIGHGKPDGRLINLGDGTVTERDADGTLAVKRELSGGGTYDALDVPRAAGDTALTKFREGRWWYPTVYRDADGTVKGTYVNICTPVECFPDIVRYVDLHVDVIKHADGTVERVDDDELDAAVTAGYISEPLAKKARSVASALENAL
ncbi:DUF402 domain-containing protein [Natronocalculus amylovorans]|uniref:Probable ribonuclease FAU-1 n=1 Tax=Natronocalculus amylovorans TaxID=2917812 RepID=A0AAE3FUL9_9EURY|nr:DUF402 domain-containing protein [Natronocalculus amylovorans]MCL9815664.1 DUF402 domain-containing protein [Natronocalculus amylovorans]